MAGNPSGEQWVGLTEPTDPSRVKATRQGIRQAHEEKRNEQGQEIAASILGWEGEGGVEETRVEKAR